MLLELLFEDICYIFYVPDVLRIIILRIFLVENYPKNIEQLPDNLQEVQHRARDIMFSDKTVHNVQMSKAITYYLRLIDDLYKMLERHFDSEDRLKESTLLGAYLFAAFANA